MMRRTTLATMVAWVVLAGGAWAADVTPVLVEAQTQFEAGHYEQALKLYKQAQDEAGGDAFVEYDIGLCHMRLGDGEKAAQHFEQVASRADAPVEIREDAFFNVGVIRATAARARLDALLHPQPAESADPNAPAASAPPQPAQPTQPPAAPDAPENIEELKGIAGALLQAIAPFRECERIAPSEDAQHNMRAIRITRRDVLGMLKRAVEAKEKEDMLKDPPAYLEALIAQQHTATGLTRRLLLDPPTEPAAMRGARRAVLRLERQILERTGLFADNLAQFVESAEAAQGAPPAAQGTQPQGEPEEPEPTPREQVYHAAADQLEHAIEKQRDASAFLMDGETEPSFDHQLQALDEMYVALRVFPQEPQQALVKARTVQAGLRDVVEGIEAASDWLQDARLGRAPLPDDAEMDSAKTAVHYDQKQVLNALAILRAQCEHVAESEQEAEGESAPAAPAAPAEQEKPPILDPELNRTLADILSKIDTLGPECLEAIAAQDKDTSLARQQDILDMIDAALEALPKTIEQRIAALIQRQALLNEEVKAEVGESTAEEGEGASEGMAALQALAAEARSKVLGGPPAQVAERVRTEQADIDTEADSVNEELRQQIPSGSGGAPGQAGGAADGQSQQVQAYIEASKHMEQAGFEMLVAIEGLDKAIVQDALGPLKAEGPVQPAQANALEELVKALAALRPPQDQQQQDQQDKQQQQQQQQESQESENARRAVERADQEREQAERELHQRKPREVIKDW